ncbi:hypothetical protein [Kiloniella litopenaei]|uniref:hypothetical protein n=1 Tax=Kiloniella litopenaei TaxID=1549748 RepID=UPI003BAB7D43
MSQKKSHGQLGQKMVTAYVCETLGNIEGQKPVKCVFYDNGAQKAFPREEITLTDEEFKLLKKRGQVTTDKPEADE